MKESYGLQCIKAYAQQVAKQLNDQERIYYYFMGILMYVNWKDGSDDKEANNLKRMLIKNDYINESRTIDDCLNILLDHAVKMLSSNEINDIFFEDPKACLLETYKMAWRIERDEANVNDLWVALAVRNFYWMNSSFYIQPKAFILTFYYLNELAYEVHIATNSKELLIGRDENSDICFDKKHDFISNRHCLITCNGYRYYLQDLGSTQSTYVNDILIGNKNTKSKYVELRDGDIIGITKSVKVAVNILNHKKLKNKKCMLCQKDFLTDDDNHDLCPICSYGFAKDFGEELNIKEVDAIPPLTQFKKNLYNQKVVRKGNKLDLTFKFDKENQPQPVAKDDLKKVEQPQPTPKKVEVVMEKNDIIPGYEKIKIIGEGGMGSVYLVKERKTGQLMALKTIKNLDKSKENEYKMRVKTFEREADIQQQMNHKYIAKQYAYGDYDGMKYILMKYYEHGTLANYVDQMKKDRKLLKNVLIQILEGLDYLHHASLKSKLANGEEVFVEGIVHRDIKPQNIFVDFDSKGNMMVKIADFGLSKAYEIAGQSGFTLTGAMMGTFAYMPRQQLENTKYAKPEVDIWAAVAVAYALATGAVPKPFGNGKAPLYVCTEEKAISIRKRDIFFPSKFAKIIDQALDDSKDLYYQEATDLIHDLLEIKV